MSEAVPSRTMLGLPIAEFAFPGPLRDRLVELVLTGEKTATAGLVADFVVDGDPIPRAGDRFVVVDSDGRPVAIIETTECTDHDRRRASMTPSRSTKARGSPTQPTGGRRTSASGAGTSTTCGATRRSGL